jgi:threonine/homoserine/homoserine lactone efflux protein
MLLSRPSPTGPAVASATDPAGPASMKSVFLGGFWTNALNPKVALFFLAFVPQFIAPGTDNKPLAFFLLGVLFNFNAIFVNVAWALVAGWTARRVGIVQRGMHWLQRGAGALFVGFGFRLALSDNPLAPTPIH